MSNQHLFFACLVSFVVGNFPEPMTFWSSVLLGVICAVCGFILSKKEEQEKKVAQDNNQE
jgi:flagellar biosynthesis component FlhA